MSIEAMKQFIRKNILWALFIAYACFNIYLLCVHEMWRDEMNVWLIGRDLSVGQLFRELKYQGHPCLWYLLIMPFAKLGLPCQIMGWISLMVMSASCYMLLFKSSFSTIAKACLIFSPLFTYYYSVIARGYCLVALLIVLLACFYEERYEKPILFGVLLGFLVQADTIAVPIAGLISAIWGMEALLQDVRNREWKFIKITLRGIWIPLLSAMLYLLTMAHVSDSPVFEIKDMGLYDTIQAHKNFASYILERLTGANRVGAVLFGLLTVVVVMLVSLMKKNGYPVLVLLGTYLFQVVFSVMVYELNIWHFLSLGFVLLWFFWVTGRMDNDRKWLSYGVSCFLIVFSMLLFYKWTLDTTSGFVNAVSGSYSDAKNTADYISENVAEDEIIVETDIAYASSIWGYIPSYKPYFVGNGQMVSYADWSENQSGDKTWSKLLEWFEETFPEEESFILICTNDSHLLEFDDVIHGDELIYETKEPSARQEDYKIYRIYANDVQ